MPGKSASATTKSASKAPAKKSASKAPAKKAASKAASKEVKETAPKTSATKASTKAATKTAAKTSAKSTTKSAKVVETTPVAAPVETATVVEKTQLELLEERFDAMNEQMNNLRTMATSLTSDFKTLRKDVVRAVKKSSRRKRTPLTAEEKAARPPSGFAKPTLISDELCGFLGKPVGTEVARTEVTKFLASYIKENKLQDPEKKKVIHPDTKLKALLNCEDGAELTFFTIQKYMKDHFKTSGASSK